MAGTNPAVVAVFARALTTFSHSMVPACTHLANMADGQWSISSCATAAPLAHANRDIPVATSRHLPTFVCFNWFASHAVPCANDPVFCA